MPPPPLAGKYRIEEVLGEGAFGRVYLAFDVRLRRSVAIKELLATPEHHKQESYLACRERFEREARAAAIAQHPNIVAVFDLLEDAAGNSHLVMEYVWGTDLRKLLAQSGALPVEQVVNIALDIASALQEIHGHDIVHRDLKPANIMITRRGVAKLTDFGIAQVGHESQRTEGPALSGHPGTPLYMSPEQAGGYAYVDGRSDLYSLGLVLYEALVGEPWGRKRRPLAPARPDTPPALVAIVEKLMQRPIELRYDSADALIADLRALTGATAAAVRIAPPEAGAALPAVAPPAQGSEVTRDLRPLIGRDREQALLRDHLAAAAAGQGSLVLIGGEAGIGKSALTHTVTTAARTHGMFVATGHCDDRSETPPYGPWREILDRLPAGDLPPVPFDPDAGQAVSQAALFAQVRGHFATLARRQPLLLVLDNIHWADTATLEMLRMLAREATQLPLLLVATYRTEEVDAHRALAALLPALARESGRGRLELRRFTPPEMQTLVTARYHLPDAESVRLAAYLSERAEGNPFFIEELLRTLEVEGTIVPSSDGWALGELSGTQVPSLLRHLIDGRLAQVGEAHRKLLAVAAVIGQEVAFDLWMTVSGADEEALVDAVEQAIAAHVVRETPDGARIRFFHALIREALSESVPAIRRRVLHRRIAEALAATPRADAHAVAAHFQRAGDARAVEWLVRAGDQARTAFAWLTAAERYQEALELMETYGAAPVARGWLLTRLARIRRYVAPQETIRYLVQAERSAVEANDPALNAHVHIICGVNRCLAGDLRRGVPELEAGVHELEALPDAVRAAIAPENAIPIREAQADLITWLALAGRCADARALGETVVSDWDDRTAPAAALHGIACMAAICGNPEDAQRAFIRAKEANDVADNAYALGFACLHELQHLILPYQTHYLKLRERVADAAEAAWARATGIRADLAPRLLRVPVLALQGEWEEARALALAADTVGGGASDYTAHASMTLGEIAYHQGDTELAWALIREWLPEGPQTPPGTVLFSALSLMRVAAALAMDANDLGTARDWLEAHDRWLAWSGATLGRAEGALGWAQFARASGDPGAAFAHAEQAVIVATRPYQPLALIAAHRVLGEISVATGAAARAEEHLERALALAAECAAPVERARTLLVQASLLATYDPTAARTVIDELLPALRRLNATPALTQAEALAARLP